MQKYYLIKAFKSIIIFLFNKSIKIMGAGALIAPLVGSVFGVSTTYATFMGLSTVVGSGLLGMSLATTVLGSAVIIGGFSTGVYFYTRKNGKVIQRTTSQAPLSNQQLHPNYSGPNAPKWEKLEMSQETFERLRTFSSDEFQKRIKKYICPISMQIMREPSTMKCCQNLKSKTDRYADNYLLLHQVKTKKKCLLCHQFAEESYIQIDEEMYDEINGFRQRLLKTYKGLSNSQKLIWKNLIDQEFGEGYTVQHLE